MTTFTVISDEFWYRGNRYKAGESVDLSAAEAKYLVHAVTDKPVEETVEADLFAPSEEIVEQTKPARPAKTKATLDASVEA